MNNIIWFRGSEYAEVDKPIEHKWENIKPYLLESKLDCDNKDCLGLYFEEEDKLKASYFVGQVWFNQPEKWAISIVPKQDNRVDYFSMTLKCLEYPVIATHLLKDCFYLWSEKKPLPLKTNQTEPILLLIISQFLKELSDLCRRHIRRGFPRIEENLYGRCKGRVLIKKNILHNSARGRLDRIYCQFQIHSMNTLENQILKAALEQSLRFLRKLPNARDIQSLWGWATESESTLSEVTLRRIYPAEFQNIRYSGIMKVYKKPHTLAKIILQALGTDPNNPPVSESKEIQLPPYAIDMNELFERYCEALLIKKYKYSDLWVGYGLGEGNDFPSDIGGLRPDFLLMNKHYIIDAKYRYLYEKSWDRSNIEQLCLYARHKKIREKLGLKKGEEPEKLIFLYPEIIKELTIKNHEQFLKEIENPEQKTNAFYNIYKVGVPLCKYKNNS